MTEHAGEPINDPTLDTQEGTDWRNCQEADDECVDYIEDARS